MNTETVEWFTHEGFNLRLLDTTYSVTIPWKVYDDKGFLAGGKTREAAIEAAKLTIDNRLNPKPHKVEGGFWGGSK